MHSRGGYRKQLTERKHSLYVEPFSVRSYKWIVPLNYITSSSTKKVKTLVLKQEPSMYCMWLLNDSTGDSLFTSFMASFLQ